MDEDVERAPEGPLPEPIHSPETGASACSQFDAEQQEINAEQRDTLAAVYAAHLDERERLQDDREELRNKQHDKRDRTADHRDRMADQRDLAADQRDKAADVRDQLADLREAHADERELIVLERNMQIDIREAAADQRELESETDLRSYTADRQTRPDKSEP